LAVHINKIQWGVIMSKYTKYIKVFIIFNVLILSISVQATTSVNVHQSGGNIIWQVSGNTYSIENVRLTVSGPTDSTTSLAGCTSLPVECDFTYLNSSGSINTSGFSGGLFKWEIVIKPLINNSICDPTSVRDLQGGLQGLSGQGGSTPEDLYLNCLINSGIIPLDSQELTSSGFFTLEAGGSIIVPDDNPPTASDNVLPIALCADQTIEGSGSSCSVYADINNGSYDPDGTVEAISQSPDGPYGLGVSNVTLMVTDNLGDSSSCSAVVTVTDSLAPSIECPLDNTMSPNTAPATFTATTSDTCSIPVTQVVSHDCYRFNPRGRRIDTNDSCVVELNTDGITVIETSGVDSFIDWTIESTDSEGNTAESTCTVNVIHPNG
jgi:hypothetical protein